MNKLARQGRSLRGALVFVTGDASGIGRATAQASARRRSSSRWAITVALFWGWLLFAGALMPRGRLPRRAVGSTGG